MRCINEALLTLDPRTQGLQVAEHLSAMFPGSRFTFTTYPFEHLSSLAIEFKWDDGHTYRFHVRQSDERDAAAITREIRRMQRMNNGTLDSITRCID
jgi:hypothetical protein